MSSTGALLPLVRVRVPSRYANLDDQIWATADIFVEHEKIAIPGLFQSWRGTYSPAQYTLESQLLNRPLLWHQHEDYEKLHPFLTASLSPVLPSEWAERSETAGTSVQLENSLTQWWRGGPIHTPLGVLSLVDERIFHGEPQTAARRALFNRSIKEIVKLKPTQIRSRLAIFAAFDVERHSR